MTTPAIGELSNYTADPVVIQGFSQFLDNVENITIPYLHDKSQEKIKREQLKVQDLVKGLNAKTTEFIKLTWRNQELSEFLDSLIATSKQGQSLLIAPSFREDYEVLSKIILSVLDDLEQMKKIVRESNFQTAGIDDVNGTIQSFAKSAAIAYESTTVVIDCIDAFNALSEPKLDEKESTGFDWLDKLRWLKSTGAKSYLQKGFWEIFKKLLKQSRIK